MPLSEVPQHIAIIMDGNGRWAEERGLLRTRGHREGAKRVDEIVTECTKQGIRYLTLYTFSTENWSRPKTEVSLLMRLLVQNLRFMDKKLVKNRVKLTVQGTISRLPKFVQQELTRVIRLTAHYEPKMELNLALSYGARQEIVDAAKEFAKAVDSKRFSIEDLNVETFAHFMYRPGVPDPDLLIRTGGESRVSNFLLWQIAYSELLVVPEFWPDFFPENLQQAIQIFQNRARRFGKTQHQIDSEKLSRTDSYLTII